MSITLVPSNGFVVVTSWSLIVSAMDGLLPKRAAAACLSEFMLHGLEDRTLQSKIDKARRLQAIAAAAAAAARDKRAAAAARSERELVNSIQNCRCSSSISVRIQKQMSVRVISTFSTIVSCFETYKANKNTKRTPPDLASLWCGAEIRDQPTIMVPLLCRPRWQRRDERPQ